MYHNPKLLCLNISRNKYLIITDTINQHREDIEASLFVSSINNMDYFAKEDIKQLMEAIEKVPFEYGESKLSYKDLTAELEIMSWNEYSKPENIPAALKKLYI